MKTFEQLQSEYNASINAMNEAKKELYSFEDGFEYLLVVNAYRTERRYTHSNSFSAIQEANEYYENNGFCRIYTNNTSILYTSLNGGSIVYCESPSLFDFIESEKDGMFDTGSEQEIWYQMNEMYEEHNFAQTTFNRHYSEPGLWKEEYFFGENEAFRTIWKNRLSA